MTPLLTAVLKPVSLASPNCSNRFNRTAPSPSPDPNLPWPQPLKHPAATLTRVPLADRHPFARKLGDVINPKLLEPRADGGVDGGPVGYHQVLVASLAEWYGGAKIGNKVLPAGAKGGS